MNGKIALRIVSALVLVAAIAGIGFFAFRAGVAQGSPITIEAPAGQPATVPYPYYGYGMPFRYGHHMPFFGLGCFGILIPLFLFFIAMRAFRFAFWGRRWGHMGHHHGPWGRHDWGERGVPPMFDEWHKRAHNPSEANKESAKDSE